MGGFADFLGIDTKGMKKTAEAQVQATKDAAAATVQSDAAAAQAAQNQIEAANNQRIAQDQANDLLNKPLQNADVDLASTPDQAAEDDDLLGRRKTVRSTYQPASTSGIAV